MVTYSKLNEQNTIQTDTIGVIVPNPPRIPDKFLDYVLYLEYQHHHIMINRSNRFPYQNRNMYLVKFKFNSMDEEYYHHLGFNIIFNKKSLEKIWSSQKSQVFLLGIEYVELLKEFGSISEECLEFIGATFEPKISCGNTASSVNITPETLIFEDINEFPIKMDDFMRNNGINIT